MELGSDTLPLRDHEEPLPVRGHCVGGVRARDVIRHGLRRRVDYVPMMRRTRPSNVPDTTAMSHEESWQVIVEAGRKIVLEGVDVACEGCPDNMEMYAVIQYRKTTEKTREAEALFDEVMAEWLAPQTTNRGIQKQ